MDSLIREPEDVVDYEDCACGAAGTGGVALGAIEVDVFAFGTVAFADGWRNVAACLRAVRRVSSLAIFGASMGGT